MILCNNATTITVPADHPVPDTEKVVVVSSSAVNQPAVKKKLALVYVNEPKTISGPAIVANANELIINNETIFLFGIYVDPNISKGQEAKVFLDKTIGGRNVDCNIEAYTYQGIATGICNVGQTNLNKALVEKGMSKNVALELND